MKTLEAVGGKVKDGRDQVKAVHNKALDLVMIPAKAWSESAALEKFFSLNNNNRLGQIRWYANYTLYGAEMLGLGAVFSMLGASNMVAMGVAGALVGGLIRGYDGCEWQKKIAQYPVIDSSVGILNGLMCCAMYSVAINALGSIINPAWAGQLLAFAAVTAISSNLMCKIEEHSFKFADGVLKSRPAKASTDKEGAAVSVSTESSPSKSDSCCSHADKVTEGRAKVSAQVSVAAMA